MQDGFTRKMDRPDLGAERGGYLDQHRITLVLTCGPAAGSEYVVQKAETTIGRGPDVDLAFNDDSMSKQHAALELLGDGFRIRDLGSTNGIRVNGSDTLTADLKHGDSIQIGEHTLQFLVERIPEKSRTYVLRNS